MPFPRRVTAVPFATPIILAKTGLAIEALYIFSWFMADVL
jgi:hypothetical protein